MILFEVIFSKNRFVLNHIIIFLIIALLYLMYTWVIHSIKIEGEYVFNKKFFLFNKINIDIDGSIHFWNGLI